jgi:hypothetical protein
MLFSGKAAEAGTAAKGWIPGFSFIFFPSNTELERQDISQHSSTEFFHLR